MKKNNTDKNTTVYENTNQYITDIKDTYIYRLTQEQTKLLGILRGNKIRRFDSIYDEIVDRINTEEM